VVLTLVAEVLAGETLITPGGAVDMVTASGLEAFTWDGWLEELSVREETGVPEAEVTGTAAVVESAEILAD
jgi:hypothetical protein